MRTVSLDLPLLELLVVDTPLTTLVRMLCTDEGMVAGARRARARARKVMNTRCRGLITSRRDKRGRDWGVI